jgi:flagellin
MTRINTNVSSLVAQNTLNRSSADLQQALTRLSTGLQINSGKDDPAGLIASEALRADMTSIEKAISNSTRANLMIGTADSALGQVSSLLNDIRGLVVEAANVGAMSSEQIEANQLQVDSSLEAINRIAQTTTFQGRRLLDGSLAFNTTAHTVPTIRDVQIDQANLGATGQIAVEVDISSAATVAQISNTNGFTTGAQAEAKIEFSAGAVLADTGAGFLHINSKTLGDHVGVKLDLDHADQAVEVTFENNTIKVKGRITEAGAGTQLTSATIAAAINGADATKDLFVAEGTGTAAAMTAGAGVATLAADSITLTAVDSGADYNGVRISVVGGTANGAVYNADQNTLTITVDNTAAQDTSALAAAIEAATTVAGKFTATASTPGAASGGSGRIDASAEEVETTANTGTTGG